MTKVLLLEVSEDLDLRFIQFGQHFHYQSFQLEFLDRLIPVILKRNLIPDMIILDFTHDWLIADVVRLIEPFSKVNGVLLFAILSTHMSNPNKVLLASRMDTVLMKPFSLEILNDRLMELISRVKPYLNAVGSFEKKDANFNLSYVF